MASRKVLRTILSREQGEGVGARVRRSIGGAQLRNFDPFLMLDEFNVQAPAGFPDHPHRGFETVTYMLDGTPFVHEDFTGHSGTIKAGDLQWMTAGRGIVHSEMPQRGATRSSPPSHGLQLWVNLSRKDKMCKPNYQELEGSKIAQAEAEGVRVKVIAGTCLGVTSPVRTKTPTMFLDVAIEPGHRLIQPIPAQWNAFAYTLSGPAIFGPNKDMVAPHHTVIFSDGTSVEASVAGDAPKAARFVLLAGKPHGRAEPIVQHGPFVMNSQAEIRQAIHDYQNGVNGFEGAATWESKLGKQLM